MQSAKKSTQALMEVKYAYTKKNDFTVDSLLTDTSIRRTPL